jgi:hypothetical protein
LFDTIQGQRQTGHQPKAALDALDHQVTDISTVDAAGRRHSSNRLAAAIVESEGDAHPLSTSLSQPISDPSEHQQLLKQLKGVGACPVF